MYPRIFLRVELVFNGRYPDFVLKVGARELESRSLDFAVASVARLLGSCWVSLRPASYLLSFLPFQLMLALG